MKAHIGADAKSGLTHTLVTTAGNVSDAGFVAPNRTRNLFIQRFLKS
jgi:hypothetical protein